MAIFCPVMANMTVNPIRKNNTVLRNLAAKGVGLWPMVTRDQERPFKAFTLTKAQIREFLIRLAGPEGCQHQGFEWRCGGKEYKYARKVLSLMHIPKAEQNKFLDFCKELGGYCDCEILMNAAESLLGEPTPW